MDSIQVAENATAGTIIKTITPVMANGGAAAATYALVDGKFSIDNAKFDIFGGILTNNNILASGIYWIRYRVTVGFDSVEKGLKIYTDDQAVTITVSDLEYPSDIAVGGEVATVSLSAGSTEDVNITPQSELDDAGLPAFEYDGPTGEIRWTGNQTAEDYTYNIQYTGACIKPILNAAFEVTGGITVDEGFYASASGHYTTHTWDQVRDLLDDAPLVELAAPIGSWEVKTYLQYSSGGTRSMLGAAWKVPATPGATSLSFGLSYQRYPGATTQATALLYYQGDLPTTFSGLKSWTLKQYTYASSGSSTFHWDDILPSLDLSQPFYIATVPAKWYDGTGDDYAGSGSSPFISWSIDTAPSIS